MKDVDFEVVSDDMTTSKSRTCGGAEGNQKAASASGRARNSAGNAANPSGSQMRSCGRSCFGTLVAVLGIFISLFWILNLGMGIFEIPDALPIVGNLDEAFFTMVFLASLSYLDIKIPFLTDFLLRRKK